MVADIIDSEQCAEIFRCTPDLIEELARAGGGRAGAHR